MVYVYREKDGERDGNLGEVTFGEGAGEVGFKGHEAWTLLRRKLGVPVGCEAPSLPGPWLRSCPFFLSAPSPLTLTDMPALPISKSPSQILWRKDELWQMH